MEKFKIIAVPLDRKPEQEDVIKLVKKSTVAPHRPIGTLGMCLLPDSPDIDCWQPQQVFLVRGDEIKDGWCIVNCSEMEIVNAINKIESVKGDFIYFENGNIHKDYCEQIIAVYPLTIGLPTLRRDFLGVWCDNPVDEVEVICFADEGGKRKPLITHNEGLHVNEVMCCIPIQNKKIELSYEQPYKRLSILEELEETRKRIFDIANSYAGEATGHIAVELHQSSNHLTEAIERIEKYDKQLTTKK